MQTIKDVTQLFIVEKQTPTADLEGDTISVYSDLKDGEVAVCNHRNVVLDGASGGASLAFAGKNAFKLIGRVGTKLIHSDLIEKGTIKLWSVTGQSAEVQQVDYVGSNGVTGSLDTIASNLYTIRLYIQGSTITDFMQQKIKEGFYKSTSAAASYTQEAVATGLYDSLVANFSREPEEEIRFGRISDASRTALGTGVGTVVFTKGSTTVTAGTDVDDATTNAVMAVGEYISAGTAVTNSLYKIVSIDTTGNTLQIDKPFKEATVSGADTTVGRITVANQSGADWGIKLLGIQRAYNAGIFNSAVVQWKTTIDFGDSQTTVVNETTSAYPGIGTAQQVGSLEKELQADNHVYRSFAPQAGVTDNKQVTDALVASGELYDMCVLEYSAKTLNGLGVEVRSPKTLQIAGENSTNLSMSDANQGVVQTIDEIVQVWEEEGFTSDQDANLT
jgi:hypothetical protein